MAPLSGVHVLLWAMALLRLGDAEFSKPYPDAGLDEVTYTCTLDPKVSEETFHSFKQDIQEMWGYACGRNRGIFVLDPPDGHTYGCGKLPESWGVKSVGGVTEADPKIGVKALSNYIQAVYNSSIEKDIGGCSFNGLSQLKCGRELPWMKAPWYKKLGAPIRAANVGGLFMLEAWILPSFVNWGNETGIYDQYTFSQKCHELGICEDLLDHWRNWYTQDDFMRMKSYNLNAVRLPVGYWYFHEFSNYTTYPYLLPEESIFEFEHPITQIINYAKNAGLQVILDLHGAPGNQNGFDNSGHASDPKDSNTWGEKWLYDPEHMQGTVATLGAMATYINYIEIKWGLGNVMALELLNEPWSELDLGLVRQFYDDAILTVRTVRPLLPIILHDSFRPHRWSTLFKNFPWRNVYFDTHVYLSFTAADVASDSEAEDRLKMYAHEKIMCEYSGSLRWQTCNALPTFVGEFSLAIDNCMVNLDARFKDYGQCDRIDARLNDPWWTAHYSSLAQRSFATFERELGWAFWTWKLDDVAETTATSAVWWSFRLAVEKGYIDTNFPGDGCQRSPVADFAIKKSMESSSSTPRPSHSSNQMWLMFSVLLVCISVGVALVAAKEMRARGMLPIKRNQYSEIPSLPSSSLRAAMEHQEIVIQI